MNNSGFGATWHPCKMESFLILRASCKKSIRFVIIISLLDNAPNYLLVCVYILKLKLNFCTLKNSVKTHKFMNLCDFTEFSYFFTVYQSGPELARSLHCIFLPCLHLCAESFIAQQFACRYFLVKSISLNFS